MLSISNVTQNIILVSFFPPPLFFNYLIIFSRSLSVASVICFFIISINQLWSELKYFTSTDLLAEKAINL